MTGIGDEIGAHLGEPVLLGQVAESEQEHGEPLAASSARELRHGGRNPPLHRHALENLNDDGLRGFEGLVDGLIQLGIARHVGQRLPIAHLWKKLEHEGVVMHDVAVVVERDGGVGNGIDKGAPALAVAVAWRQAPRIIDRSVAGPLVVVLGLAGCRLARQEAPRPANPASAQPAAGRQRVPGR